MNDVPADARCSRCGGPLASDAPEGLCPRCLMALNLAAQTEAPEVGPSGTKVVEAPPPPSDIARYFPQLEILECLGRGGMGMVYKARQPRLDRLVALKILLRDKEKDPHFAERFQREARALARLNHPNIVTVYDFGETNGLYYLLMEFVDGVNLRHLLRTQQIRPEQALAIVPRICEALQYAHEQRIVHRDIKPENILLDNHRRVKIADFGIAKIVGAQHPGATLTGEQQVIGTPHYMAPEQVEKPATVDHRADIYSLGVVFYEMLTGELPLGKFALPSKKVQVDVRLDEIVLRSLEKQPEHRYQRASEVKSDVDTVSMTSAKEPLNPQRKKAMNSHKTFWQGMAVGAACLVVAGAIGFFILRGRGNAAQLTREGWELWQSRHLSEAAEKFNRAVKLAPKDTDAWNGLGWASFNSGRWQEAEKAFQKVIALEPNHPAALNGLGQLSLAQRKYEQAESYLLKAAPQAPAAWYGLARLYLLQGKFEEAEKWARKVVESGQADEGARQMLQAAQKKQLSESLRLMLEPPPAKESQGK